MRASETEYHALAENNEVKYIDAYWKVFAIAVNETVTKHLGLYRGL